MPNPIKIGNTAAQVEGRVLQVARVFDVRHYGAKGDGVTNDAAFIDAALAAAKAGGGGIVYFPKGHYVYNGAGLLNNPGATTFRPIRLKGDGPHLSTITFEAVTNAECVRLAHQQAMGSGYDWGQGVEGLRIVAGQSTKDIIYIKGLEHWHVRDVVLFQGRNAITIEESRSGVVQHGGITGFSGIGVKVIGEAFCANHFYRVGIAGGAGVTWGFEYVMTSAGVVDAGGIYLTEVVINTANGGGGFKLAATGGPIQPMYVFMLSCVADGPFTTDAFLFSKIRHVLLSNCWGVIFPTGGDAAFHFDGAQVVTMVGGEASVGIVGKSDFLFTNACEDVSLKGVQCDGSQTAYKTDATQHTRMSIDNPPFTRTQAWSNDATKILDGGFRYPLVTPFAVLVNENGLANEFALQHTNGKKKHLRLDANGVLQIVNDAHSAVILEVDDAGNIKMPAGSYIKGKEVAADPVNTAANEGVIFLRDNGAGKSQWAARFPTGAVVPIVTEP